MCYTGFLYCHYDLYTSLSQILSFWMEEKVPICPYYAIISKPDASMADCTSRCYGMFVSCYWMMEKQEQLATVF